MTIDPFYTKYTNNTFDYPNHFWPTWQIPPICPTYPGLQVSYYICDGCGNAIQCPVRVCVKNKWGHYCTLDCAKNNNPPKITYGYGGLSGIVYTGYPNTTMTFSTTSEL